MNEYIRYAILFIMLLNISFILVMPSTGFDLNSNDKGPLQVTLNPDGKKPAKFPHQLHQEKLGSCMFCHDPDLMDIKLMTTDKNYAHKKGCGSCHMKIKGLRKLKCKDCHPRKKVMVEGC